MNGRWVIAGAAALGLGLAAIPFMSSGSGAAGVSNPVAGGAKVQSAAAAGVCSAKQKPAPLDFTLKDMDGKDVKLADYKGKVIMLNFWATWCGPCKYEIPMFVELQNEYRDKGVVFLGVSVDDEPAALQEFAKAERMNYPVLVGAGHEIQNAYGPIFGVPTTMLISREGVICTRYSGPREKAKFESDIKALL